MKKPVVVVLVLLAAAVAAILFWPGRKAGPEPIAYGRDTCAECRMAISQKGLGGEMRDAKGNLTKYDDVGCLLAALEETRGAAGVAAWVDPQDRPGTLVPLRGATLVRGETVSTPMDSGIVAFAEVGAAARFAQEKDAEILPLDRVGPALAAARTAGAGGPAAAAKSQDAAEVKPGEPRPFTDGDVAAGKPLFVRECSACHGERGDGEGPAATWLDPRPRNLTKRTFKLRSTESGQPPRTADLRRTIERGIPGSSMPAFSFLTPDERRLILAYVLEVADLRDGKEPASIPDPGTAPPATPESATRGQELYEKLQCWGCHGRSGKGDGPGIGQLKDDEGRPIAIRDFTNGVFRGGAERADLYLRFVTGMDGSPMPSYGDSVEGADRWALVDYVMSLRVPAAPVARPSDPIQAGRQVAEKYSCRGCHVLDDGKGGETGPDLRISALKLSPQWVKSFLHAPREVGKIYPWRVSRMPHLGLTDEEVDVLVRYLAAVGKKEPGESLTLPDAAQFPAAKLEEGKNLYVLRCAQCHQIGGVIETPPATQQGPDLVKVASRIEFHWSKAWILDPQKVDPKSKMTIPGLKPDQVDSVMMFVWKASLAAAGKTASRPETAATP